MPKDYARYANQPKRTLAKHGWRRRLLLVIVFLFLILSAGYGFFIYKHYQNTAILSSFTVWLKKITTIFEKKPANVEVASDNKNLENKTQEADIQFSFYTNLPAMQVSALPGPEKIIVKKEPQQPEVITKMTEVAAENKYLLQLAAFKNPSSASEMRISLLLIGFEVDIVKTMRENQPIYQVQQGPYSRLSQAKNMQQQLKKKGIESVIVKKIA